MARRGKQKCIQSSGGEAWGKSLLRKLRRSWENNIKADTKHIILKDMGWIDLEQERENWWAVVKIVMNLKVL